MMLCFLYSQEASTQLRKVTEKPFLCHLLDSNHCFRSQSKQPRVINPRENSTWAGQVWQFYTPYLVTALFSPPPGHFPCCVFTQVYHYTLFLLSGNDRVSSCMSKWPVARWNSIEQTQTYRSHFCQHCIGCFFYSLRHWHSWGKWHKIFLFLPSPRLEPLFWWSKYTATTS